MATGTIFDFLEEPSIKRDIISEERDINPKNDQKFSGKKGFFEQAYFQKKENKPIIPESVKNFGKNVGKAAIQGLQRSSQLLGAYPESIKKSEKAIEQLIPSKEGGVVTKTIERALKEAPSMLAFPGGNIISTAARTGLSAVAGQTAEELGAGETVQSLAELSAFLTPSGAKKLLATKNNKGLIDAAKELGLTENQIAPLLNSPTKQKFLAKIATPRGRTERVLEETKQGIGDIYEKLKSSDIAKKTLSTNETSKVSKSLEDVLFEIPANVREKISQDLIDLKSKPITGDSLINFWKDINSNLGPNTRQLSLLKTPIIESLKQISPKLAEDFKFTNELYSKYKDISSKLKPSLLKDIFTASDALKLMGGIAFGSYPLIIDAVGEHLGKNLARELLINPRFHNISGKYVKALNENKYRLAKKLSDSIANEIKKDFPKQYKEIKDIDYEKIEEKSSPKKTSI